LPIYTFMIVQLVGRMGLLRVRSQPLLRHASLTFPYRRQPPTVKRIPPKNYSENYLYRDKKLRIAKTK
jgi:hypothetical protein